LLELEAKEDFPEQSAEYNPASTDQEIKENARGTVFKYLLSPPSTR
jgi:hypothetical protein